MIASNANRNFLVDHYEWVALGVAVLALAGAGAYALGTIGVDPGKAAEEAVGQYCLAPSKEAGCGVKPASLGEYVDAVALLDSKKAPKVAEVGVGEASFLASSARIFCENPSCRRPMPFGAAECPFCKQKPVVKELPVVVADTDGDGMTDDWERKFGLNPNDAADAALDKDLDAFTNLEEFTAKTDPTDKASHPDYLDSLSIALPLLETKIPFVFEKVSKLPSGKYRCFFKNPTARNDYGGKGVQYSPIVGEDIGDTGYKVVAYEEKSERQAIKAVAGEKALTKAVDVSTATVERKSDKRQFTLRVGVRRHVAVDVQAKLVYNRGGMKEMKAVVGDTLDLSGKKYVVKSIDAVGKGAKVVIADLAGAERTIQALEQ